MGLRNTFIRISEAGFPEYNLFTGTGLKKTSYHKNSFLISVTFLTYIAAEQSK